MNNMCNCENGKVNLADDGILFVTDFKEGYYELECAICGEKINISEDIYKRYESLCIIDIRDFVIDKSFYHEELNYVLNMLKRLEKVEVSYEAIHEILAYIIYIYNKEYYELFYMYSFEVIRENIVRIVINKYAPCDVGYDSYESFLKDLIKEMKNIESDFDMIEFLTTNTSKNIYVYGPCAFNDKIEENPNHKFLQKHEYKENELEINLEIMSLQLENSEKIERYIVNCYKCNLLSDNFIDLLYKYKKDKRHSFYKSFLQCMNDECKNEIMPSDEVVIVGLKVALAEVLEVGYIDIKDITFENYKEILQKLKNNKEIIKKFLSKE